MVTFSGPILNLGKSVTGITYTKNVLMDLVEKFNEKYKGGGTLGQIAKVYPINPHFDFKYMSHIIESLEYDEKKKCVIANIEIMDNVKGLHLLKLLEKSPDKIKICPVLSGETKDKKAIKAELIRVDFFYNNTINF